MPCESITGWETPRRASNTLNGPMTAGIPGKPLKPSAARLITSRSAPRRPETFGSTADRARHRSLRACSTSFCRAMTPRLCSRPRAMASVSVSGSGRSDRCPVGTPPENGPASPSGPRGARTCAETRAAGSAATSAAQRNPTKLRMTGFRQTFPEEIDRGGHILIERAARPAAKPPRDHAGRERHDRVAEPVQRRLPDQAELRRLLESAVEQLDLLHVAAKKGLLRRQVMRGDVAELREVDAEEVPIRIEEADLGFDERAKLLARVVDAFQRRRGQRVQAVEPAVHRRPVDVVLGLEVEVEGALGDPGRIGNVTDGRLPEAPAGEHPGGGGEVLSPAG